MFDLSQKIEILFEKDCNKISTDECIAKRVLCICNVILQHPLFSSLERKETHGLSAIADLVHLDKKQILFSKNQTVKKVYFVLKGALLTHDFDSKSSRDFVYQIAIEGSSIALELLFASTKKFPYSCTAASEALVLSLDAELFEQRVLESEVLQKNFLQFLSEQRLQDFHRLRDLTVKEVWQRLEDLLRSQKKEISLISKTELAGYLSTVPATLSRSFSKINSK